MNRLFIYLLFILLASFNQASAQYYDAEACNHDTGDCYSAEVDIDSGTVTIELSSENNLILELEDEYSNDITAYDSNNNVYYDIEIFK